MDKNFKDFELYTCDKCSIPLCYIGVESRVPDACPLFEVPAQLLCVTCYQEEYVALPAEETVIV